MVMVVSPGGSNDIRLDFEMVACMFCAYVLLCILPCFQQLLGIFGVCSQGFPRFASLCGVFPQVLVRGIVRSLLVFEHVCAGGGGGAGVV